MKRYAILCGMAAVAPLGCTPGGVSHQPAADAAVAVMLDGEARCGGVHLGEGWILTAQHCVQFGHQDQAIDRERLAVGLAGSVRSVRSVATLRASYGSLGDLARGDLAVLRVDGGGVPGARGIRLSKPTRDEDVFVLAPRGVLRTKVRSNDAGSIYTAGVTCEGDSGGALVDRHGAVVGIASWRTAVRCGQGLSVHSAIAPHSEWIGRVTGQGLAGDRGD